MDGTSGSLRRPQRAPSPSLPGEDAARWAVSQQVGPHPASLPAPCPGRPPAGTTRNELPLFTSRRVCPSGTEGRGPLRAAKPTGPHRTRVRTGAPARGSHGPPCPEPFPPGVARPLPLQGRAPPTEPPSPGSPPLSRGPGAPRRAVSPRVGQDRG